MGWWNGYKYKKENRKLRYEEYNKKKVDKITRALELLDITEKEIVEECYFRNTYTNQQIISNMCISKAKFYKVKNDSLRKIAISLGYL